MEFRFELMAIPDVLLVTHGVVRDQRGFFLESFREEAFLKIGIPRFVQDNHAKSTKRQPVIIHRSTTVAFAGTIPT